MKTSDKRIGMMTMSKAKAGGKRAASAAGFTMIELMMTLSIAAIVTVLAVPSFRYVTNANRIAAEINGLLGDLQFARAEAIKEGRFVTACVSTTGTTCTGTANWEGGWIVFSDPTGTGIPGANPILRTQKTFSGTDTFFAANGLSTVTFNREGYAGGIAAGQIITLHDASSTSAWTRCLSLNLVGQMTTEKVGDPTNVTPCT